MSVKINKLEIENVKRVKAVTMEPTENGLTIIGGNNGQGKTSVLDSIAWALGGNKFRPSQPAREGSVVPPKMRVELSNGLIVERKGENGTLKVTDPSGNKAGQALLDSFVEKLALDLPKFMLSPNQEKAVTLLNIIGVGPQLAELDQQEKQIYTERTYIGRDTDAKKKHAASMEFFADVPDEPVSAAELLERHQEILARNAQRRLWAENYASMEERVKYLNGRIDDLTHMLEEAKEDLKKALAVMADNKKSPEELKMESTEEIEADIRNIEEINRRIRCNLDREKAEEDAKAAEEQYKAMTAKIEDVRSKKKALLDGAKLPLQGLTVEDGCLLYNGQQWDNISGSDQLIVSTAIIRELNPECGFVLMDKLEQMDLDTLHKFGVWLQSQGLQVIATRVSTGDECSIIIEDGYSVVKKADALAQPLKDWKGGF